jgi:hypothetical protein
MTDNISFNPIFSFSASFREIPLGIAFQEPPEINTF